MVGTFHLIAILRTNDNSVLFPRRLARLWPPFFVHLRLPSQLWRPLAYGTQLPFVQCTKFAVSTQKTINFY